ncbi:MAG: hypothetical protein PHY95_00225 [Candidatus ainarchaeum sp.]|nr:hypothetical protein [Candidatus ainarchaeum sp.]
MKQWLRAALIGLMLFALYVGGMPPTILLLFALIFGALLLFKDKIWSAMHNAVNGVHFMKGRPDWMRYVAVLILFMVAYYVLKLIIFSVLKVAGYDLQQELINAMGTH